MQMDESIERTIDSLTAYGERYQHWAIAWSGGKDSTALVTLVVWLITSGRVPAPESLTVLQVDTRMELTPLAVAAADIRDELEERGIDVRVVQPPLDDRFLVYIVGRGVPPPNNNTLRWCTSKTKVLPMQAELERVVGARSERVLMLTGVRLGESAVRDARIAMSCSRNGAECGQGWFQRDLPEALCDTLAPILHWRVCHVWRWLRDWAPSPDFGDWSTKIIADAYGGDEAEEINARTGCVGCPLASKDTALDAIIAMPHWSYLAPLKELRPLYRWLRKPENRLRKPAGEARKDGSLVKNQQRMGPITLEARSEALETILALQADINREAEQRRRPRVDLLNQEEETRIRELIEANTWPQKWTGEEPRADAPFIPVDQDGREIPMLPFGE